MDSWLDLKKLWEMYCNKYDFNDAYKIEKIDSHHKLRTDFRFNLKDRAFAYTALINKPSLFYITIQLPISVPREGEVLLGLQSNHDTTINIILGGNSIRKVILKKFNPSLTIENNCLPLFLLTYHDIIIDGKGFIDLIYINLPYKTQNELKNKFFHTETLSFQYGMGGFYDSKMNLPPFSKRLPDLSDYGYWPEMVRRKYKWLLPIKQELMAKACHPSRLKQIMSIEESVEKNNNINLRLDTYI